MTALCASSESVSARTAVRVLTSRLKPTKFTSLRLKFLRPLAHRGAGVVWLCSVVDGSEWVRFDAAV